MIGVVTPCLARAVVLAREGQTVIYLTPDPQAAQTAWRLVEALGDDVSVASLRFGILTIGPGCLQILPRQRDLCDSIRGRVGVIVLHVDLRGTEWRSAVRAINGHRWGSMLAARADGLVPVPAFAGRASDNAIEQEAGA